MINAGLMKKRREKQNAKEIIVYIHFIYTAADVFSFGRGVKRKYGLTILISGKIF